MYDDFFKPHFIPSFRLPPFLKPNGQLMFIHAFVQKDGKSIAFCPDVQETKRGLY